MAEVDAVEADGEVNPWEASLFIGGMELKFERVGELGGQSVYGQLRIARTKLRAEIDEAKKSERWLDMPADEAVVFLFARLEVLNWLIANIVPTTPQFPPR